MGAGINYMKHLFSNNATWKEIIAHQLTLTGVLATGALANSIIQHPEQFDTPSKNSIVLIQADGNTGRQRNGQLEPDEAHEFLYSRRFELDGDGDLTQKGIRNARSFVEPTKEIVPNHARVVLSTLDAIKLKQEANYKK